MKTRITIWFALALFFTLVKTSANAQTCTDLNEYVPDVKEVGPTGAYTLQGGPGNESRAAQTYLYSGRGWVRDVRVRGSVPLMYGSTRVRVKIYEVDGSGMPTGGPIATTYEERWFSWETEQRFDFPGFGVYVDDDFAVSIELTYEDVPSQELHLSYTGDGDGDGEDLASLSGSSTGYNWTSAMTTFSKDGDFYILPRVTHDIESQFEESTQCVNTGESVEFTNNSDMSTDDMFNLADNYYEWDFGDGTPHSFDENPTHTYATAGSYTATLTTYFEGYDGPSCSDVSEVQISVGTQVSATALVDASCYQSNDGSATAVPAGGTAPYEYNLNGGSYQDETLFDDLAAGDYVLGIRDALGCTAETSFTIDQPTEIIIATVTTTNASCGESTGSINVTASGGTGSLEYQITGEDFQASGLFSDLPAGSYEITVRDANDCEAYSVAVIGDAGAPEISLVSYTNVSCNGGTDGSITVIGSGGTGALEYSLDDGPYFASGSFASVSAGDHGVTVRDGAGCVDGLTITITEPPVLEGITLTVNSHISCHGGSDGEIEVSGVTGGTGTYYYNIGGLSQTSTIFSGLEAGDYVLEVEDVTGCVISSEVTVTQPDELSFSSTIEDVECHEGSNGVATLVGIGGTPPYHFSLDGDEFQSSGVFDGLEAGSYTAYIVDDNDCEYAASINISEPSEILADISVTLATCGNPDGGFLVTGSGGNGGPFEYSVDGVTYDESGSYTGFLPGTHIVIVRDAAGCEEVFSFSILSTTGPSIDAYTATDITCFGGEDGYVEVTTVSGGTGLLEYSMDGSPFTTDPVFATATAGEHTIVVKDAVDCYSSIDIVLTEPEEIVVEATATDAICFDGESGTIDITAAGGIGVLAYSVNDGETWQPSPSFSDLEAGVYDLAVKDAGGCIGYSSIVIAEPTEITLLAGWGDVSCADNADGTIIASSFGGTGTIEYSLDGITFDESPEFTDLAGGEYTVYAQDENGCIVSIMVTIDEPTELSNFATVNVVTCAGGDDGVIDLTVEGGVAPYAYGWSNGESTQDIFGLTIGTYSVSISDFNGCTDFGTYVIYGPTDPLVINGIVTPATSEVAADGEIDVTVTGGTSPYTYDWSNGETTADLTDLAPGDYTVTVTDSHGCSTEMTFTISNLAGIDDNGFATGNIKMYPNPAKNIINIDIAGNDVTRVVMMNIMGEIIYEAQPNDDQFSIDVSGMASGMYLVQLFAGNSMRTERVEVLR
jgi:PKD repeat protein